MVRQRQLGHDDQIVGRENAPPDGKSLSVAFQDGTVRLLDAESGTMLRLLKGHDDAVTAVAFNPKGGTLATASNDRTVKVWDAAKGDVLHTLAGHSSRVVVVA